MITSSSDLCRNIYGKNRKKNWLVLCCATYFHLYNLKILNCPPSSLSNRYRRVHWAYMLWSYHHATMITKSLLFRYCHVLRKMVPFYLFQTYHNGQSQNQSHQIPMMAVSAYTELFHFQHLL
jgi:hypothetical protein